MNAKLSGKSDTSHGHSGMLTTSDIVNNCTSTATNKPLAAAQGKVLMDKYNQLNSDKLDKSKLYKQLWYGEWASGTITVPEISDYKSITGIGPGRMYRSGNGAFPPRGKPKNGSAIFSTLCG